MRILITSHIGKEFLFMVVISVIIAIASPIFSLFITELGHKIPNDDIVLDYILGIVWALFLGLIILLLPIASFYKKILVLGWIAKIFVTLGFMLFYENHYGLDSYVYYELSTEAGSALSGFEGFKSYTSNAIMIYMSKIQQMIFDSYHATKVSFAMLGFIGISIFYRAAVIFFEREDKNIFYFLALFPSILFWSSILGKEPIVFLGISLYVYGVVGFYKMKRFRYLIVGGVGILVATVVRQWLGPIMVFPMLILFFQGKTSLLSKIAVSLFVIIAIFMSAKVFMETFEIEVFQEILTVANRVNQGYVMTESGSQQELNVSLDSVDSIVKFLPFGAFTALFRPLPGEVMNLFGLLAGLESLFLILLFLLAIKRTRLMELKEPLILWAMLFTVIWALVHGIVSSANLGVAARYKLQILPVLLGLLFYLSRKRSV
ncbi:MAG: hypothetical protein HQL10_06035 [Nitrospirae bacterium]|nr:hypothetical protein [Nitrospirota bacterium]